MLNFYIMSLIPKHKNNELVKYGKLLHAEKLVIGTGGNISERDGVCLIIKRKGADMSVAEPEDYLRFTFLETEGKEPATMSSETPVHVACYRAKKDIGAIIHAHPSYVIAAAARNAALEGISYEFDYIIQSPVPLLEYISPGSKELAEAVAREVKNGANAVLLKKHGAFTFGTDLNEAFTRMVALERAAITYLHSQK